LESICKLKLVRNSPQSEKSEDDALDKPDGCTNDVNITSGYSPELRKFFSNCQSTLLKQSYYIPEFQTTATVSSTRSSKSTKPSSNDLFLKPIFSKNKQNDHTATKSMPSLVNEQNLRTYCKDYLVADELVYKTPNSASNHEYYYEMQLENKPKSDKNKNIPKICADFIAQLETQNKPKTKPTISNVANYEYTSDVKDSSEMNSNKYKKCFVFRNKPGYIECMKKHYKCFQYLNDIENLKKCRKMNGITVAMKIKDV
jgi:hypothetical protein